VETAANSHPVKPEAVAKAQPGSKRRGGGNNRNGVANRSASGGTTAVHKGTERQGSGGRGVKGDKNIKETQRPRKGAVRLAREEGGGERYPRGKNGRPKRSWHGRKAE